MTDKIPALPEPVAYQYRWKIDGEWVDWRVADASQKHPALTNLEERPLYPATALQEALDRVERAEEAARTWEHNWQQERDIKVDAIKSFRTAEAALAGARKVIELAADERTSRSFVASKARQWLSANPEVKG